MSVWDTEACRATPTEKVIVPADAGQLACLAHGGEAGTGPFTPTPPPPPPRPWKLAGKCRTMGAKGVLSKFCLT